MIIVGEICKTVQQFPGRYIKHGTISSSIGQLTWAALSFVQFKTYSCSHFIPDHPPQSTCLNFKANGHNMIHKLTLNDLNVPYLQGTNMFGRSLGRSVNDKLFSLFLVSIYFTSFGEQERNLYQLLTTVDSFSVWAGFEPTTNRMMLPRSTTVLLSQSNSLKLQIYLMLNKVARQIISVATSYFTDQKGFCSQLSKLKIPNIEVVAPNIP